MRRSTRIATLCAVFVLGVIGYSSVLFAMALARDGMVTVRLEDRGEATRIQLPLPGVMVEAGAAAAPWAMGRDEMEDVRGHLEPWAPFLQALMEGVDEMPDGNVVEVYDDGDHVRISKLEGTIQILVDSDDTRVEVVVPTRTLSRSLEHLLG